MTQSCLEPDGGIRQRIYKCFGIRYIRSLRCASRRLGLHIQAPGHSPSGVLIMIAIFGGVLFGVLSPSDLNNTPAWLQCFALAPPGWAEAMKPLGDGFIKLINMLIAPVIFFTIIRGVAGMRDAGQVGRVGVKTLLYFLSVTFLALALGWAIASLWRPGKNIELETLPEESGVAAPYLGSSEQGVVGYLLHIIPDTVIGPFAKGEILPVLLLAILFGFALASLGKRGKPLLAIMDQTAQAFFRVLDIIMKVAPVGIFGAMAFTTGKYGVGALLQIGAFIMCFYGSCLIFIFVVLGAIARLVEFNLFKFIHYTREELLTVFGTSSSETALSRMVDKMIALGCDESVVGLVIPAGYSFNLAGTCIYLIEASLFLAQAKNIELTFWWQLGLIAVLMVTSRTAAGVTGSGFIVLGATLSAVGQIPKSSMNYIVGVDRFMSEARALTNLIGIGVAAIVISRWEGVLDVERMRQRLG